MVFPLSHADCSDGLGLDFSDLWNCHPCHPGFYASADSDYCRPCPKGFTSSVTGATDDSGCTSMYSVLIIDLGVHEKPVVADVFVLIVVNPVY